MQLWSHLMMEAQDFHNANLHDLLHVGLVCQSTERGAYVGELSSSLRILHNTIVIIRQPARCTNWKEGVDQRLVS